MFDIATNHSMEIEDNTDATNENEIEQCDHEELPYKEVGRFPLGNQCALLTQKPTRQFMFTLGCLIQRNCGTVLFLGLLVLSLCSIGLKTVSFETDVERLWVEADGRVQKETAYTRKMLGHGSGAIQHVVQQRNKQGRVLNQKSLLFHLEALRAYTNTEVTLNGNTWTFTDLCSKPPFPLVGDHVTDQALQRMTPCAIMTPLDCFWEGAKLHDNTKLKWNGLPYEWKNLHPVDVLNDMRLYFPGFSLLNETFRLAGIESGYVLKPCLDQFDPECASNRTIKDYGSTLTGGCHGFAANYMHWPEEMIMGGIRRNAGKIEDATSIQSIILLISESYLFEIYDQSTKLLDPDDWSVEQAEKVLKRWKSEANKNLDDFLNENNLNEAESVLTFTFDDFANIFNYEVEVVKLCLTHAVVMVYLCGVFVRKNSRRSTAWLAIVGVVLTVLNTSAGLGLSSIMGISFNWATISVLPYLLLGLSSWNISTLIGEYNAVTQSTQDHHRHDTQEADMVVGHCLKNAGLTTVVVAICNSAGLFIAAVIPIPAIRTFCLQTGITVMLHFISLLILMSALFAFDLKRKATNRPDVCCFFTKLKPTATVYQQPSLFAHQLNERQRHSSVTALTASLNLPTSSTHLAESPPRTSRKPHTRKMFLTSPITSIVRLYLKLLSTRYFRFGIVAVFMLILIASIPGLLSLEAGFDVNNFVATNTPPHRFIENEQKLFGIQQISVATTGDVNYPRSQKCLYELHGKLTGVDDILKKTTLTPFWLARFKDWLSALQRAFDRDRHLGLISSKGWKNNASDDAVLAYKLLTQTGDPYHPISRSRVLNGRLVDSDGVIFPNAFYCYLTAWASIDALGFELSNAHIRPYPRFNFEFRRTIAPEVIRPSKAILFAEMPLYLVNMTEDSAIIRAIKGIRDICDESSKQGLPAFPRGSIFLFWEQYLTFRIHIALGLSLTLGVILFILAVLVCQFVPPVMVTCLLGVTIIELLGFFVGYYQLRISAVTTLLVITSAGIGLQLQLPLLIGFLTTDGKDDLTRLKLCLRSHFAPIFHSGVTLIIASSSLAFANYGFIVDYFCVLLLAQTVFSMLNALLLLPALMLIFQPKRLIAPDSHIQRCETHPTEQVTFTCTTTHVRRPYFRTNLRADFSLGTISEESTQYGGSSHDFRSNLTIHNIGDSVSLYSSKSSCNREH